MNGHTLALLGGLGLGTLHALDDPARHRAAARTLTSAYPGLQIR